MARPKKAKPVEATEIFTSHGDHYYDCPVLMARLKLSACLSYRGEKADYGACGKSIAHVTCGKCESWSSITVDQLIHPDIVHSGIDPDLKPAVRARKLRPAY